MENNNINNITKPVSLIMDEAEQSIINGINEANLHPTLLEMVLEKLYLQVKEQARVTAERERTEYQNACMIDEENSKETEATKTN